MALVHESLYRAGALPRIRVHDYLSRLVEAVAASFPPRLGLARRIEAGPETLSPDLAVHCGLIINELVSNAFRHAYPDPTRRGTVTVRFRVLETGAYELSVEDDGVGIPPAALSGGRRSLGLELVRTLALRQLGGRLAVEHDGGTRIRVTFRPGPEERAESTGKEET